MSRGRTLGFFGDERGGATVWALLWFILFVGICGLAVDITDGFRAKTMLQATADSAALAGAIELPDEDQAVTAAVDYSTENLPVDEYGHVLLSSNVEIGSWDAENHIFSTATPFPDAVRVIVRRTTATDNEVPVNFLRILGLRSWDVTVHAIAQRFIPDCLTEGLLARGTVDIESNNRFGGGLCIHGNDGIDIQMGNDFADDVRVTMPDLSEDLQMPASGLSGNSGLASALGEDILDPRMVNHINEIIDGLLAMDPEVTPDYIDTNRQVETRDEHWNFADARAGRVYHVECASNRNLLVPSGTSLSEIVVVAECNIGVASGATVADVVLASRGGGGVVTTGGGNGGNGGNGGSGGNNRGGGTGGGGGNGNGGGTVGTDTGGGTSSAGGGPGIDNANIGFAASVVVGLDDDCSAGGGVQLFSTASVKFSAGMELNGVQIVAAGDIDLGTNNVTINGINAQAGGDIDVHGQNTINACPAGTTPSLFTVDYFRLVF